MNEIYLKQKYNKETNIYRGKYFKSNKLMKSTVRPSIER